MAKKPHESLAKIVHILSDGRYHDGTSIGESVQMTRSAVWKTIKKLVNYGVKIDSVKGKGYILPEPLVLLDINNIKKNIANNMDIVLFETIDSTNHYLKSFKNIKTPKVCIAEKQTHGKGRFNREWYSPFGKNLYFSCLYPFQKDVSELAGLSLLTSLAIVKTLQHFGIQDLLSVKWSNDVVHDNKKISGNLIEVQAETHAACQAIIGVGINVNMLHDDSQAISQQWTSLGKILGQSVDRNVLCSVLINYLLAYLQRFDTGGFAPFVKEWNELDCLMNKTISLNNVNNQFVGRMLGINNQGYLLLELPNGDVRTFSSGETTILKK